MKDTFNNRRSGDSKPRFDQDRKPRSFSRDRDSSFRSSPRRDDRPPRRDDRAPRYDDRKPQVNDDEASFGRIERNYEVPTEERIAKAMARAGVASRRDAEVMINEGRVTLNGEVLTSPAQNVTPTDVITVDGEPLPTKERTRLWIFHKPTGLVTTARDPQGRPTVFERLPEELPRVVTVGRLDINTEGLLLLTNDGGLARVIAHPSTGWLRRYKVRAYGEINQETLDKLSAGITIDDIDYGPIEARLDRQQGDNVWMTLGLREGKNREIKRILEHIGLQVNRLIRLSFGPFQLGDLEVGLVEEIRTRVLKDQLGESLAAEANVDFESPVREPIAPFGSEVRREREQNRSSDHSGYEERPQRRFDRDDRPQRSFSDRGDRPPRPFSDRGDRPQRSFSDRGDRPPRSFSDRGDRPPRSFSDRGDRPQRSFSDRDGGYDKERSFKRHDDFSPATDEPKPRRPLPGERPPSIWRADDVEAQGPKGVKIPRRGTDAKEARTNSAPRERETVGSFEASSGRQVVIERLKAEPTEHAERSDTDFQQRPPRSDGEGYRSRPPRDRDDGFKPRPPRDGEGFRSRPPRDRDGGFNSRPRNDGDGFRSRPPRDRDDGFKPRPPRDGEGFRSRPPRDRDDGFKPRPPRDGEGFRSRPPRDRDDGFKPRPPRDGEGFRSRPPRDRDDGFKPRPPRDGEGFRSRPPRDRDDGFKPRPPRDGEGFRSRPPRDRDDGFKPRPPRDGEGFRSRPPRERDDGFKPRAPRSDGDRKQFGSGSDRKPFAGKSFSSRGSSDRGPARGGDFKNRKPR